MILTLASLAGSLLAKFLQAKGKNNAAAFVTEGEAAVRSIIAGLAAHAETETDGEVTADDVHAAVHAAMVSVDALIAEAEASLRSRQQDDGA